MQSKLAMSGVVRIKKIGVRKAPLTWRIQNTLRWSFLRGWFITSLAKLFSKATGVCTLTSELVLRKRNQAGEWIDYGVVSYLLVTDAGVAFLVDDWDVATASATNDITTLKYHGVGTGATAEAAADTALVTESTTALNPDSTRPTGVQSQPAANQLRSTGTITFDASAAITEHGLFSAAPTGTGTLWDRSVFSVVNMASGETLQAQYTCTVNSGG